MKQGVSLQLIIGISVSILLCGCFPSRVPAHGGLEKKFPVKRAKSKLGVLDQGPIVVVDQEINPKRGIWLLEPHVELLSSHLRNREDSLYIIQTEFEIEAYVKNKFIQDEWIMDLLPSKLFQNDYTYKRDSTILDNFKSQIKAKNKVDFSQWKAPELLTNANGGYNLFLYLNGPVGYEAIGNQTNRLYLFLIDNNTSRVTYADYLTFQGDIRNLENINRILEYTFLKLLDIRFPKEEK